MYPSTSVVPEDVRHAWPDLSRDRRAYELAKITLGENAPISAVLLRAQEIKATL